MQVIFFIIAIIVLCKTQVNCINSYIYLTDKVIQEELPIGTVILELNDELNKYYYSHAAQFQSPTTSFADQQYTFLDEIQTRFASSTYFLLDPITGRITTKRYIDRESMCLNRHCMETCMESGIQSLSNHYNNSHLASINQCKLNLKILLQPSSNIVSVNIIVDDINDNKPQFRKEFFNQTIPENVPIGYRIPIELAFDPDVGRNGIQYYELINVNSILDAFELKQNLNELQLALVVKKKLDREAQSSYSFAIVAHDGGQPSFSGRLDCLIQILDINDNNPQFDTDVFKFTLREDTLVGTQIGYLHAFDLDEGLNAKIKYSLVGSIINGITAGSSNPSSIMHNYASYFDIDLYSGLLTLRKQLDYEDEPIFSLTVEARDCGVGSLPAYATIEISLIDCNDNSPEISVSFLNSLKRKITGTELGFNSYSQPLIIYLNENTEMNKFIAHVSITDKDSAENGRISWFVELNKQKLLLNDSSNYLKIALLNNNSFTINTGKKLLDREEIQNLNLVIHAWDHGAPKSNNASYKFKIEVIDENDNKPKFDNSIYNLTIYENNKLTDIIAKFTATDADSGENGRITYRLRDSANRLDEKFFTIDFATGVLLSKRILDREQKSFYRFYVSAIDNGAKQQLSTSALVNLKILDVNDNAPKIYFFENETKFFESFSVENQTLVLSLSENLQYNTQIIAFHANDSDLDDNTEVKFYINDTESQNNPFRINENTGQLYLAKKLDREHSTQYALNVKCENIVRSYQNINQILASDINLIIKVTDVNDNCPFGLNLTERKFIDASKLNMSSLNLFRLKYIDFDEGINSRLAFTLLNYKNFFDVKAKFDSKNDFYNVEINLKSHVLSNFNLKLGKYVIKLQISDYGEPKCVIVNHFQLFIGNETYNNYNVLVETLKSIKEKSIEEFDFQYDQINYDYDYNLRMKQFYVSDDYEIDLNATTSSTSVFSTTEEISNVNANMLKKFKLSFIDFDHILVFIMVVIIVLIGILITLLGAIFFYKKYSQLRIKKILKDSSNISSSSANTNDSIDDFEKLKFEQQQYYFEKQKQKKHMQSYSITNNSSTGIYSSNNLSLSLHSTNDDSLASSVVTKETKLNNLSVANDQQPCTLVSSSSVSSASGLRISNVPFSNLRSMSGYTHPMSNHSNISICNDEMIILDSARNGGVRQIALPISTINSEILNQARTDRELIYTKPIASQKEKHITFINSKSFQNNNEDIFVADEDEDNEEYNEKFSFLNDYKVNKQNSYKNSDL